MSGRRSKRFNETSYNIGDNVSYIINGLLFDVFKEDALKNYSNSGDLNETMAILLGYEEESNRYVSTELIYPKQKGSSTSVVDLGKYKFHITFM